MLKIDFKEYQDRNFEGFKKINESFEKEGIFWWAHSGVVLGAAREGGQIPWDDDIDMGMTIYDYAKNINKIKEIANKNGYKLANKFTRLGLDISRLVSKEKYIVNFEGKEYVGSLFIDIMIGLPVKKHNIFRARIWSITNNTMFIFNSFWKPLPNYGWRYKGDIRKIMFYEHIGLFIIRILLLPLLIIYPIELLWFKISSKKEKRKVAFHANWSHLDFIYDKDKMKKIDFGTTRINVRENYLEELSERYGVDWKIPIQKNRRVPHHMILVPNNGKKHHIYPFIIK